MPKLAKVNTTIHMSATTGLEVSISREFEGGRTSLDYSVIPKVPDFNKVARKLSKLVCALHNIKDKPKQPAKAASLTPTPQASETLRETLHSSATILNHLTSHVRRTSLGTFKTEEGGEVSVDLYDFPEGTNHAE